MAVPMNQYPKSDVRDEMYIDWNVPIEMADGVELRCDIFRPLDDDTHPVIMSHGPYGKWLHFEDRSPCRGNTCESDTRMR